MKPVMAHHPLLEIQNLQTHFYVHGHVARAVDDISLSLKQGQTLGLVGESGCGKSVTAHSIIQLIPDPPGKIVDGKILLEGKDLLTLSEAQMRNIRGNRISMIFQEPMTSLNPVFPVGDQVGEVIRLHQKLSRKDTRQRVVEMFKLVGIPAPESRLSDFPHQMSGGMRQRVMIAMALACRPMMLIADEPTTALDVTIQAQILDLMRRLQSETGTAILFITHNLGVVAEIAQRVVVMYAGRIVEEGDVRTLFKTPRHPYTRGLLACMPHLGKGDIGGDARLDAIPGNLPSPIGRPLGCTFAPRCAHAEAACTADDPALEEVGPRHFARCRRWRDL